MQNCATWARRPRLTTIGLAHAPRTSKTMRARAWCWPGIVCRSRPICWSSPSTKRWARLIIPLNTVPPTLPRKAPWPNWPPRSTPAKSRPWSSWAATPPTTRPPTSIGRRHKRRPKLSSAWATMRTRLPGTRPRMPTRNGTCRRPIIWNPGATPARPMARWPRFSR